MTSRLIFTASIALLATAGLSACADESAPNRRGIERPPLFAGQGGMDNADKRENEPHQRDLPTGGGQEFPGQSRLDTPSDASVVTLADLGITAVNTPVPATGPATQMAFPAPTTPPPQGDISTMDPRQPYAVRGRTMVVPNTGGLAIPPTWGDPIVLKSYPHRPYADTTVTYASGRVLHNPFYYTQAFPYEYNPTLGAGRSTGMSYQDFLEIPWFYGQSLALPVLMVIDPPLAQRSTVWNTSNPLDHGKLPPAGAIVPAPWPGEIRYSVPPAATQPVTEVQSITNPTTDLRVNPPVPPSTTLPAVPPTAVPPAPPTRP